jgi:hypothetical protein
MLRDAPISEVETKYNFVITVGAGIGHRSVLTAGDPQVRVGCSEYIPVMRRSQDDSTRLDS